MSPVHISTSGDELFTIGSFYKKDLVSAINSLKKFVNLEVIYLEQKKINNISFFRQNPVLTDKQKQAMNIAIVNGYYLSPRKTELKKLSDIMGCSYSTFQVHLRKAECKLIPFSFKIVE